MQRIVYFPFLKMLYLAQHHVIDPGTAWWWTGIGVLLLQLTLAIRIGKTRDAAGRKRFEQGWGALLLLIFVGMHFFRLFSGDWHLEDSLPLQMCGMSHLLAIAALLFQKRWAFLPLFFWGLAGGIHSFLTPEVTLGNNPWFIAEYYFTHASIIASPLYLIWVNGYRINRWDWLKALWWNNLTLLPIALINFALSANYMYLCVKPIASNPFVVGEWPWYILGFELAAVLHYVLLTVLFRSHWARANGRTAVSN